MTNPSRGGCPAPWPGESEKALGDNRRIDVSGHRPRSGPELEAKVPRAVPPCLTAGPIKPEVDRPKVEIVDRFGGALSVCRSFGALASFRLIWFLAASFGGNLVRCGQHLNELADSR